jgi:glyoxylase-like metal-dependent hydrolase (beta-lactamase superfamily II)
VITRTYSFDIGEYKGVVLYDYSHDHSAEDLIIDPVVEELEKVMDEFDFIIDAIPVGYNNLLLRSGKQSILVDAGIGRPIGELCLGLEELAIDPGDIDWVVITHSDRDHIGGILDEEGKIAFPNARYVMLKDSWAQWSSEKGRVELIKLNMWTEEKMQFAWETYSKIQDLMLFVEPKEEFISGIQLIPAPGHRYDHSVVKVTSSGEQLLHISDALAHPLFMGNTDWYSTYDANPAQALEIKRKLMDMCVSENLLVFGAHFPFPGLGYVKQEQERWGWQPVDPA